VVAALLAFVLWLGGRLKAKINDDMRAVWMRDRMLAPPQTDALIRMRGSRWYIKGGKLFRRVVFPTVAGVAALWMMFSGVTQLVFSLMSSAGAVCVPGAGASRKAFASSDVCWDSGVRAEQGATYRITMHIEDPAHWTDGGIVAGANGYRRRNMSAPMYVGLPIRRYPTEAWFQPVVRIGRTGSDEYVLKPASPPRADAGSTALVADITARRSGNLYLFVNDAVLPVPNAWQVFYKNNTGMATIEIERTR
jgi:hypothetical protein